MASLVDRYLEAVAFFVPRERREQAVREVGEELRARLSAAAAGRGTPPTEEDQVDILRQYGHPVAVAARYRGRSQLMGPFLPVYLVALKAGIGVALVVSVALAMAAVFVQPEPGREIVERLLVVPDRLLLVFVGTTLAFAGLEIARKRLRLTASWDPRRLPWLPRDAPPSRWQAAAEALAAAAGLVWLLLLPGTPHLLLGRAAAYVAPGPVWRTFYVPLLAVLAAMLLAAALDAWRPDWRRGRSYLRLGISAGTLVVLGLLLRAEPWFVAIDGLGAPGPAEREGIAAAVSIGARVGALAWMALLLVEIAREGLRLGRGGAGGAPRPAD